MIMEKEATEFARFPAIRVEQPLGEFYAVAIPARTLLRVCYTDRLRAVIDGDSYRLDGSQRDIAVIRPERVRTDHLAQIAGFMREGFHLGAHFMQGDINPHMRRLPGRFRTGHAAANDMQSVIHVPRCRRGARKRQ